jgi:opacity protein-like surface antigen
VLALALVGAFASAALAEGEMPAVEAGSEEGGSEPEGRSIDFYFGIFTAGSWATGDAAGVASGADTDHSFYWGANLGTEFPIAKWLDLRLEFDGSNERKLSFVHDTQSGTIDSDIQAWTFFGNFWFVHPLRNEWPDVPIVNRLAPFGGGGLGLSRVTFDAQDATSSGGRKQTKFAWQGGVGMSAEITRWLTIDLRYQYTDLGKLSVPLFDGGGGAQGELEMDLGAHELIGGPRIVF